MFKDEKKELIFCVFAFVFFILLFSNLSSAALTCSFNTTCVYPSFSALYVQNDTGGYYNAHAQNTTLISLEGLVGWWRFDNASLIGENDTRAFDWSGLGNNATITNGTIINSSGKFKSAAWFDSRSWVEVASSSTLTPTRNITLVSWFNTRSKTQLYQKIISKTDTGGYQISINENSVCPANKLCFLVYNTSGYSSVTYDTSAISSDVWYQMVATYDGDTMRLYLNGTEVATNTAVAGLISYNANILCIGREVAGTVCGQDALGFNGTLDDIMIFNRSLSAQEISNLYNQSYSRYNYALCCRATEANLSATSCTQSTVFKLFNYTNSHVQTGTFGGTAYNYPVCLASNFGNVQCTYTDGSCNSNYSCIASMASSEVGDLNLTNSHIGNCNEYKKNICCRINNPPLVGYTILNSTFRTNYTTENLTVFFNESDVEGDFYTNITDWRVNGTSIAVVNMPFNSYENTTNSGAVKDYSTSGNNGTLGGGTSSAAPSWTSNGKVGGGYLFDGVDDYISLGIGNLSISNVSVSNRLSISLWLKTNSSTSYMGIISKDNAGTVNRSWKLGFNVATGVPRFDIFVSPSNYTSLVGSSVINDNHWHMLTAVYNGSNMFLYTDGGSPTTTYWPNGINPSLASVQLGNDGCCGSRYFNGSMDELLIFNLSLSPEQVKELYIAGLANLSLQKIVSNETRKGQNWTCLVTGNDLYDGIPVLSNQLIIRNSLPTVTLTSPADGNVTDNRTPMFTWTGYDADGDSLSYEINLTTFYDPFTSSPCSDIRGDTTSNSYYIPTTDLSCLKDNGVYYVWSVRANDGESNGSWSASRTINITALMTISLPVKSIDFGNMMINEANDTSDDAPAPFIIQNDGNSLANVTMSANNLWQSIANPSEYYKFKIDNVTGENYAFNWSGSATSFTNVSSAQLNAIHILNYSNIKDSAEVDVYVKVPPNEPPTVRNSTMTFYASLGEI